MKDTLQGMPATVSMSRRHAALVWLLAALVGCAHTRLLGVTRDEKVAGVEGVEVIHGGAQVRARMGMKLETGDELRTDAGSSAWIAFADGSQVAVQPNSVVGISSLRLVKGGILAKLRKLFQVKTEYFAAAVEGTEYRLTVDEHGEASLAVAEGTTRLISNTNAWEPVAVHSGENGLVKGPEAPQKRPLRSDEIEKLQQEFRTFDRIFAGFTTKPAQGPVTTVPLFRRRTRPPQRPPEPPSNTRSGRSPG